MSDAVRLEIEEFTRTLLANRLAQLTSPQRALFDRIYPNGPKRDALISAIDLCDRTIRKNMLGREVA